MDAADSRGNGGIDISTENLCDALCELQSSDHSPSRQSFRSIGDESQLDSELRHLVGGTKLLGITEEEHVSPEREASNEANDTEMSSAKSLKAILKEKNSEEKPLSDKKLSKIQKWTRNASQSDNASLDLGSYLHKQARDLLNSGDNHQKALQSSLRASKIFEAFSDGQPTLELISSTHLTAAILCSLGRHADAIQTLQNSIDTSESYQHAKFAGLMQLGDTYAILGDFKNSSRCYSSGLEIQKQELGEKDARVGETCRYLAEAYLQELHLDEAEELCNVSLEIHQSNVVEKAADRRLMGLIYQAKGDHEAAIKHLLIARTSIESKSLEAEVAALDCLIGDTYQNLSKHDDAVSAYQRALAYFKSRKGTSTYNASIASVYVRLADVYSKTANVREARSYCRNAMSGFENAFPGTSLEEVASGFVDIAAILAFMEEHAQAISLLEKALKIYANIPGKLTTVSVIEVQLGVTYYMDGRYVESCDILKVAIDKLRNVETKRGFLGVVLNQMGLSYMQLGSFEEARGLFEEAKGILEENYGIKNMQTLGVWSNLAGVYDALGRFDEAIELLEKVVEMRDDVDADVDDEKRRLSSLLKESGKRGEGKTLKCCFDDEKTVIL